VTIALTAPEIAIQRELLPGEFDGVKLFFDENLLSTFVRALAGSGIARKGRRAAETPQQS
jgi:hypothetical protein